MFMSRVDDELTVVGDEIVVVVTSVSSADESSRRVRRAASDWEFVGSCWDRSKISAVRLLSDDDDVCDLVCCRWR